MSDDRPAVMVTNAHDQLRHFLVNHVYWDTNATAPAETPEAAERDNTTGNKE
jgi:hypothetical protein